MASENPLPPAVERLLDDLASVGTLELLLLLHDAGPERRGLPEICSALRCPHSWAELQLRHLAETGLVDSDADGGFGYAPRSPGEAEVVDDVARIWREDRRAVTSSMLVPARRRRRAGYMPR